MTHIHNNTEKVKNDATNFNTEKKNVNTTSANLNTTSANLNTTSAKKKQKRKKTLRSGNCFIRPPKQGLLIMRHKVILRFD
jgi:hypothetical protein